MNHNHLKMLYSMLILTAFLISLSLLGGILSNPVQAYTGSEETATSPDQLAYVTLNASNELAVIDRTTHSLIDTVDLSQYGCFAPDRIKINTVLNQAYILCQNSSNLVILNIPDLSLSYVLNYPGGSEDDVAFNTDGNLALIGSHFGHTIYIFDTISQEIIDQIPLGDCWITSLESNPMMNLIYGTGGGCSSGNGKIWVIDMNTVELSDTIDFGGEAWGIVLSPDGQWLYVSDRYSAGIAIINTNTDEIASVITDTGELNGLAITPDGNTLYAGTSFYSSVRVYDLTSHNEIANIPIGGYWVRDITMDCSGNELYVGNYSGILTVVDTQNHVIDYPIPVPGGTDGVAIYPYCVPFLSPPKQTLSGDRGETVQFIETLKNYTGITDTFTVSLGESLWPAQLPINNFGPISDGGEITFTVNVTVPMDAEWNATSTAVITATAGTNPDGFYGITTLVAQAYAPPQIFVSPTSVSATVSPGKSTTATLAISNEYGITLTFEITKDMGVDWLSIEPVTGEVKMGETSQVQLTFDATNLSAEIYQTSLMINSNDPDRPAIFVPVTLTVEYRTILPVMLKH